MDLDTLLSGPLLVFGAVMIGILLFAIGKTVYESGKDSRNNHGWQASPNEVIKRASKGAGLIAFIVLIAYLLGTNGIGAADTKRDEARGITVAGFVLVFLSVPYYIGIAEGYEKAKHFETREKTSKK